MKLNTMKNICLIGLNSTTPIGSNGLELQNSTTPLGSQVCSQSFGYKPQDSSGVQHIRIKKRK